jgi:hypothetical protein
MLNRDKDERLDNAFLIWVAHGIKECALRMEVSVRTVEKWRADNYWVERRDALSRHQKAEVVERAEAMLAEKKDEVKSLIDEQMEQFQDKVGDIVQDIMRKAEIYGDEKKRILELALQSLIAYGEQMAEGRVHMKPSDFERIAKLIMLMQGDVTGRQEIRNSIAQKSDAELERELQELLDSEQ